MANTSDSEHLARMKETLSRLIDHVEILAVEKDVCYGLAVSNERSTYLGVEEAMKAALDDLEVREQMRQNYAGMRAAIEEAAVAAFFEGQLQDLPVPDKPN